MQNKTGGSVGNFGSVENVRYGLQNAQPSKEGYTVEYVNENTDNEFNEVERIVCNENAIFSEDDLPAEKKDELVEKQNIRICTK